MLDLFFPNKLDNPLPKAGFILDFLFHLLCCSCSMISAAREAYACAPAHEIS